MIVKWGEFFSALDIVRHNTGMTEKTAGSRFRRIGALAWIDVIGTSYVNHYMENSKHRLEFSYI